MLNHTGHEVSQGVPRVRAAHHSREILVGLENSSHPTFAFPSARRMPALLRDTGMALGGADSNQPLRGQPSGFGKTGDRDYGSIVRGF